ncbi:MAG: FAD binding domain-containing protein [Thermoleophilia bacterium]
MRLPKFDHYQPATIEEAVGVLGSNPGARVIAGGTDLLVNMKHRVDTPPVLVSLKRIGSLQGIGSEDGATTIGATTTLKQIQNDAGLAERFPALVEAARAVGSYRHQTMGTLAGNICQNTRCRYFNQSLEWRSVRPLCYKAGGDYCHVMNKENVCYCTYSGDVAPALLVLDAQVRVQGQDGVREFPLAELYSGEGRSPLTLGPADVVTAVTIPEASAAGRSRYEKHALRGAIDFPVVGAAVWMNDGSVRVAFTAVDRGPVRAATLEEALQERKLDESVLSEVAPLARKAATITRTTVVSGAHKRELMAALFVRAARSLI